MPRKPGGSNFKNQSCPLASLTVNPGVTPSLLDDVMVQTPGSGPGVVSGPLKTSAGVSGRAPARFVYQLESGTSSTVLTFFARSATTVRGPTRLVARSANRSTSSGFIAEASCVFFFFKQKTAYEMPK